MFIEGILVLSECLLQIYTVSINKSLQGGKGKLKAIFYYTGRTLYSIHEYTQTHTHIYIYNISNGNRLRNILLLQYDTNAKVDNGLSEMVRS